MNDHLTFGAGSAPNTLHPAVLALVLIAAASVLFLRRKYALPPLLGAVFLTPVGQQLVIGGVHLYVDRLIIITSLIRVIPADISGRGIFKGRVTGLDRVFFWWASVRSIASILLWRDGSAIIAQAGLFLDACGGYLLFRYFLQEEQDVVWITKMLAVVSVVMASCMIFEYLTGVNPFNAINTHTVIPWTRDGKIRAQGVYANSITAGTFGATLMPLFFWLWKHSKARAWGFAGLLASTAIVLTSKASTPASAYAAGVLALCMWPLRNRLKTVRWGIVALLCALALVMKAPVWYLIARIDFVGGHGWDRAYLVDQFVQHVPTWFFLGSKDNATWGAQTWDACNQFVAEGLAGGIGTFILFLSLLTRAFSAIGKARKNTEGTGSREWLFWCMGAALFAHAIAFLGIDYFDQTKQLWFAFLAMISAATIGLARAVPAAQVSQPDSAIVNDGDASEWAWSLETAQKWNAL